MNCQNMLDLIVLAFVDDINKQNREARKIKIRRKEK